MSTDPTSNTPTPPTNPSDAPKLTHFDTQGQAHMVNVGSKQATHRVAIATGEIHMLPATLALIQSGTAKKGDVLGIARIAAVQARSQNCALSCYPWAGITYIPDYPVDG